MQKENFVPSCFIDLPESLKEIQSEENRLEKKRKAASEMNVSPQLMHAMQDYAKKLRRKFPNMNAEKLQKRVAEHFKIKLT